MTGTYPFFHGTDRSMSTNYFRPGFTQGVWAERRAAPGFNYIAMIGNSLNTLDIKAANIDNQLAASAIGLVRPQRLRQALERLRAPRRRRRCASGRRSPSRARIACPISPRPARRTTRPSSRTACSCSQTGALAPDVTISLANFYLWAIDGGIKYKGLRLQRRVLSALAEQLHRRRAAADRTACSTGASTPRSATSCAKSWSCSSGHRLIHGPFATAVEGAVGFNWYPFDTRQVWLDAEAVGIRNCPYGGGYYMYSVGQTGFVVPVQFMLRF